MNWMNLYFFILFFKINMFVKIKYDNNVDLTELRVKP